MIKILPTGAANLNQHKGFTLVELLVVLTIMSVLVGSISFVVFNKKDTIKDLSIKIVQNMKLAQQRAVRENQSNQIGIDFSNNTFLFNNESVELPEDITITIRTAENQLLENDLVSITFYPDTSLSGGVITLESETEIFEITMVWISGKITTKHHVKTS